MSLLPATASSSDDAATALAVGALAATLAAVAHETLGHGVGCVGIGGQITLLTSIWFRCSKWSGIVDAGGPLGNLAAGLVAFALLGCKRPGATVRLFLLMFGSLNLFVFTGQLALESVTSNRDDWYSTALQMEWPAAWRIIGAIIGIGGYLLVRRLATLILRKQAGPRPHAIRLAYAAAAASAVIAGLIWQPEPFRSAAQGFLAVGIAPLGLLDVARRASRDQKDGSSTNAVPRSWIWISVCAAAYVVFLLVQARGLGSMAGSRLSP